MSVIVFGLLTIALIWLLALLAVSAFFRGMAIASLGGVFLNIASNNDYPVWLVIIAIALLLLPMVTVFRRFIVGGH
jgi:hypothetical protein